MKKIQISKRGEYKITDAKVFIIDIITKFLNRKTYLYYRYAFLLY